MFPKGVTKFHSKSRIQTNLSKMNQNETNRPKLNEVDHDSENLVEQIEQNKLLKFTDINQNEPMGWLNDT